MPLTPFMTYSWYFITFFIRVRALINKTRFHSYRTVQKKCKQNLPKSAKLREFGKQIANFRFRRESGEISVLLLFYCRRNFASKVINRNKISRHETKFRCEIRTRWTKFRVIRTKFRFDEAKLRFGETKYRLDETKFRLPERNFVFQNL